MTDDTKKPETPAKTGHVRVDQTAETPLTSRVTPFGTALYLYARSNDSVDADTVGQDYVTFRYDETNLAFAVCDGVGQSFMGDLAARILGDALVEWMLALDQKPEDDQAFAEAVASALDDMTNKGKKVVADFKLPDHLPPILKQALENQRKYGSESMFVAGRLALGDDPWIALCWLGDSPVAAIDFNGELVDLGPHGSTAERWNAVTGVKGDVHTWVGSAENVARVAGYTDGLAVEVDDVPTDADLAHMLEVWVDNPPSDDASLFDVRFKPSPATTGQDEPPEPDELPVPEFKPIEVEEQKSPVSHVEPIEGPPESTAVQGWRPLGGDQPDKPAVKPDRAKPTPSSTKAEKESVEEDLSPEAQQRRQLAQQQALMWQQAAMLGLTSAALAMMMMERAMGQTGPIDLSGGILDLPGSEKHDSEEEEDVNDDSQPGLTHPDEKL